MEYNVEVLQGNHTGGTKFYELVRITSPHDLNVGVCLQRNGPMRVKSLANGGQRRVLGIGSIEAHSTFLATRSRKERDGYEFPARGALSSCNRARAEEIIGYYYDGPLDPAMLGGEVSARYEPAESRETVKAAEEVPRVIPSHYGGW